MMTKVGYCVIGPSRMNEWLPCTEKGRGHRRVCTGPLWAETDWLRWRWFSSSPPAWSCTGWTWRHWNQHRIDLRRRTKCFYSAVSKEHLPVEDMFRSIPGLSVYVHAHLSASPRVPSATPCVPWWLCNRAHTQTFHSTVPQMHQYCLVLE